MDEEKLTPEQSGESPSPGRELTPEQQREIKKTQDIFANLLAWEPDDAEVDAILEDEAAQNPDTDIQGLSAPAVGQEIAPDEQAISSHDLTHPGEAPQEAEAPQDRESEEEFKAMFRSQSQEESAAHKVRPPRKGRPKRKKGAGLLGIPHILATLVWLAIIVFIGVSLGRMIWVCAADALAFGRESSTVTVTISASDTNADIAQKLYDAGLIRYPGLFKLYADLAIDEGEIEAGTYELDTKYDYMALKVQMSSRSSSREEVEVLIPEGLNCREIFALLEENNVCSVEELEEYAANGELDDYWFLEGVERGDKYCLEGFLFPDTYNFYKNSSARHAIEKMLSGFEYRYTEEIHAQLTTLNERLSEMMRENGCTEEYIAENQLSLREMITVASLIEEETASSSESAIIASVIYNRLTQDQEYERYLGIDAAILYALGEHKEELTAEDLAIDSPYNTRTHAGLTPGPISNPGLNSIQAALNPADTDYYYYVLNPATGLHDFSKTLEEHEEKVEKYRSSEE